MSRKIKIFARNSDELLDALKRVDISVPSEIKGQKSESRERWSMYRLIATFYTKNVLYFPIICNHRDRPDFYFKNGTDEIGVEVTDFIHQDYARAKAISEKHPGTVVDKDFFKVGKRISANEVYDIATRTKLTGPGREGDELEAEWVKGVRQIVDDKTVKLNKKGFKVYPKNELLIYDTLQLGGVNMAKVVSQLNANLKNYWSMKDRIFNTVFIERSGNIYQFSCNGSEKFPITNLWASI
ncbi:MAG: hypothetical protein B6I26_00495 [Desulfobacteraceae bacterium 4572_130]|nr:MAG: hypothetical protein B6I26_00495 [Desulfobacteraceae bacterium 4572_130]